MAIKHTMRPLFDSAPASAQGRQPSDGADEQITFDSQRLLTAIVFHLLDDELALEVDEASVAAMRARLDRTKTNATVSRLDWGRMTDFDRLHWLMRSSNVTVSHHDGIAKLKSRA